MHAGSKRYAQKLPCEEPPPSQQKPHEGKRDVTNNVVTTLEGFRCQGYNLVGQLGTRQAASLVVWAPIQPYQRGT